MKPWIQEDVLKTWTDAQKRLWESLCSAVPLQPPTGVEAWRETYLKNLESWEAAVRRSLEQEAAWVEEWVRRIAREKGTPEMMASWVRQMEEVLHRWIQTQNQWWNDYFAILRRGGLAQPDRVGAENTSAAATAPTAEPVPAPAATPEAVGGMETVTRETPDDLKLISGIGPVLEKKLNACGVFGFRDLATLSDVDIERIEAVIKFAGRIRREDWIGQAKARYLQKHGEPL